MVTAAQDAGLTELKLAFQSLAVSSGEGLSEGDFAARLVHSEVGEDISRQANAAGRVGAGRKVVDGKQVEKVAWVVTPGMGHIG